MSFMTPNIPAPPPPPPVPDEPDLARAAVMAEEAEKSARGKRKGRGSTIVAGALGNKAQESGTKPTLMG